MADAALAFDPWYRTHYAPVVGALVVFAGDPHTGREAADEAFVRAWERWDAVSTMASPQGWTFVVGRNLVRRGHGRKRHESVLTADPGVVEARHVDPELWRAVAGLPRRQREVVVLRYVADWSEREVAEALGVSPGHVGRTLHDARTRLARALGGVT